MLWMYCIVCRVQVHVEYIHNLHTYTSTSVHYIHVTTRNHSLPACHLSLLIPLPNFDIIALPPSFVLYVLILYSMYIQVLYIQVLMAVLTTHHSPPPTNLVLNHHPPPPPAHTHSLYIPNLIIFLLFFCFFFWFFCLIFIKLIPFLLEHLILSFKPSR